MNNKLKDSSPKKGILKKFLERIFEFECSLSKSWASSSHKRLFLAQWGLKPEPEWFDHSIDVFYQWPKTNNSLWLERGVFSSLAIKGNNLLELSCGDGFNTKYFYSHRSKKVVACDFDSTAIDTAKAKNQCLNIDFILADIRTEMPEGKYENIVWDAAIEHFTPKEISSVLINIKNRLEIDGILSGYTIVEKDDGIKHIHQHEYEFKNMEDLKSFLTPHFKNVKVFETIYPSRHNLYFWASDGVLPFDENWVHSI